MIRNVVIEMNMKTKGSETVALVSGASVRMMTPESRPNMRKDSIMIELSTCLILSVFKSIGS